ncbi:winged helix-turn-helix domain-containing protein [Solirubrobacter ginsenosidimutans]|uniref:Winged helix-turn-helix domain-containing protein n=1 Tax=Solirubrobacter ginsenosidimutans TaxID=490573 RepID=A0A9X3RYK1_9ACTN|nr:BTAD domain-containing putative transcriptional regulator [Solirubrobacter ginsenosidimutans]MDA0159254.1 winged helix-turn-helix domain-containing protein [Solirubrobacter ginsenosidimutans]
MTPGIEVRLLGPLEVVVPAGRVEFEGVKQRRLFAALALRAPEIVSVDALVEAVWADAVPDGRDQALQKQVSRLRARLGDQLPVRRRAAGYALEIEREAIDSRRFERLLDRARAEQSADELAAALALWRGPALADHRFDEFAQGEIARLEELRLEAIEERLTIELARGQAADLVGELRSLVAEHPLRERLRGSLMLALYRAGRQADALEVMRDGRRLLVEELGLEPGPELRRLETMILAQDPALDADVKADVLDAPLPVPANATIGREGELAEIGALLLRADVRLLTLVGTGGVGKTRLALEAGRAVAGRFPGGVAYVDLEEAGALAPAAAAALGVVAETPAELGERLARVTRSAGALLVLDGFERFLADAAEVAQVLAAAPNLTVLATSRAPLRLTAEHAYRVQPLAASNAAALFNARVRALRPEWAPIGEDGDVVPEICARLDGLPLAIELAADRARLLPLQALLQRLDRRLEFLSSGPRDLPARQQSLRVTLEWSWEALTPPQRRLLGRLGVFEGGASLEAFHAICTEPDEPPAELLLAGIMARSSLMVLDASADGQPRLSMLDTVREFAAEQLGPDEGLRQRHAAYFLEYAERAAERATLADRRVWLSRLAAERGNLRVAFERLLGAGAAEDALRIATAFARALPWDAHAHEVRGWLERALAAVGPEPSALRTTALYFDGELALSQARFTAAETALAAALAAARELADERLEAAVLTALGRCAVLTAAASATERCEGAVAIARRIGTPGLLADALLAAAGACERSHDWQRAGELADEALALYREADDPYGVAAALAEQGFYDMVHGRLERSELRLGEAVALRRRLGDDRQLVEPMIDNAWLDLARGSGEPARHGFLDCLSLAGHVGDQFNVAEALAGLSAQAALDGRHVDAARLAGASAALHERIGAPPWESVSAIQDRALAATQGALGADAFAAYYGEGRRLSPDQAIARSSGSARTSAAAQLAR